MIYLFFEEEEEEKNRRLIKSAMDDDKQNQQKNTTRERERPRLTPDQGISGPMLLNIACMRADVNLIRCPPNSEACNMRTLFDIVVTAAPTDK